MSDGRLASLERAAGTQVSRETFERIESFVAEFSRWAGRINLIAPSTLPNLWERHILDSAQLWRLAPFSARWIDLGSGGGFPGAIIAIIAADRGTCAVTLVESNAKKVAFLRTSLGGLGVPVKVEQARIEDCAARHQQFDVVSARALAPLSKLLGLAEPWLSAGARGLFHKGRDYQREIEESRDEWDCDLLVHASIADPDSVVVEVTNLRRKP